jgi:cysteine desulfuration protein SufE
LSLAEFENLKSDFAFLDDWEDRYRHVIELGKQLPPLAEAERAPANKVRGCASQVWIVSTTAGPPRGRFFVCRRQRRADRQGPHRHRFHDLSGEPAAAIATDAGALLNDLGLKAT